MNGSSRCIALSSKTTLTLFLESAPIPQFLLNPHTNLRLCIVLQIWLVMWHSDCLDLMWAVSPNLKITGWTIKNCFSRLYGEKQQNLYHWRWLPWNTSKWVGGFTVSAAKQITTWINRREYGKSLSLMTGKQMQNQKRIVLNDSQGELVVDPLWVGL